METTLGSFFVEPLFGGCLVQLVHQSVPLICFRKEGILYDKIFALVTPDGQILDRKLCPAIARLKIEFNGIQPGSEPKEHFILFKYCGQRTKSIKLRLNHRHKKTDEKTLVRDGLMYHVIDQGDTVAQWFTSVVGTECRLVRLDDKRPTKIHVEGHGDFYTNFGGTSSMIATCISTQTTMHTWVKEAGLGSVTVNDLGTNIGWIEMEAFSEGNLVGKLISFGTVTLLVTGVTECDEFFDYMFDKHEQRDGQAVRQLLLEKQQEHYGFETLCAGVNCVVVTPGYTEIRDLITVS